MELVFVDLETAGLDPKLHAITQIAGIAVDGRTLIEHEAFEVKCLFKLENADPEALKLNSYHAETWAREGIAPQASVVKLSEFLGRHADVRMVSQRSGKEYFVAQLAGHNAASFDGPFLQEWYRKLSAFCPASYRVMCTMQRAVWLFHERPEMERPENFKLETLCRYFDVRLDGAHDAMGDCRATVELYRALVKCSGVVQV